ncbi:hypothetical protein DFP91_0152 [Pseudorhodoplanes sinuspersici]|uniref:Uncharacterized protein n=1 Tax=Pseudorhodoplanes sinuspersici TaxID=1235591 RepID=A0A1W6ZTN8_9HYPH|nr:hypothetical protein CAK95_17545 [Pseudorhodoplanes sinuspersici]RKE72290.1 hypothetical protein DFP91_0152 [Pseudorhodoplanes sinuspersici]
MPSCWRINGAIKCNEMRERDHCWTMIGVSNACQIAEGKRGTSRTLSDGQAARLTKAAGIKSRRNEGFWRLTHIH